MKGLKEKLKGFAVSLWLKIWAWFKAASLTKKIGVLMVLVGFFFLIRRLFLNIPGKTETVYALHPIVKPSMVMRNDSSGLGHYGASRSGGLRTHNGIDILVYKGQTIYAPFSGRITRTFQVYQGNTKYRGFELVSDENGLKIKVMYCTAYSELVGYSVKRGQAVANAQSISENYTASMQDHLHVELYENGSRVDPTKYIQLSNN